MRLPTNSPGHWVLIAYYGIYAVVGFVGAVSEGAAGDAYAAGGFLAVLLAWAAWAWGSVALDEGGLTRRTLFGTTFIAWEDVLAVHEVGPAMFRSKDDMAADVDAPHLRDRADGETGAAPAGKILWLPGLGPIVEVVEVGYLLVRSSDAQIRVPLGYPGAGAFRELVHELWEEVRPPDREIPLPLRARMTAAPGLPALLFGVFLGTAGWMAMAADPFVLRLAAAAGGLAAGLLLGLLGVARRPRFVEVDREALAVRGWVGRRRWPARDVVAVDIVWRAGLREGFRPLPVGLVIDLRDDPPLVLEQRHTETSLLDVRRAMQQAWGVGPQASQGRVGPDEPLTLLCADWKGWLGLVLPAVLLVILLFRLAANGWSPSAAFAEDLPVVLGLGGAVLLVWAFFLHRSGGTATLDPVGLQRLGLLGTTLVPWSDVEAVEESWETRTLHVRGRFGTVRMPMEAPRYAVFHRAVHEALAGADVEGLRPALPLTARPPLYLLALVTSVAAAAGWVGWMLAAGTEPGVRAAAAAVGPLVGLGLVARHPLRLTADWGGLDVRWLFRRRPWLASEIVSIEPAFGGGLLHGFRMVQTGLVLVFQDGRRLTLSQRWTNLRLADLERAMRRQWDLRETATRLGAGASPRPHDAVLW